MMTPPADLRARVLAAAAARPSRTRVQGRRIAVGLGIASVVSGVIVFELAGGIRHSAGRPLFLTLALAGGLLLGVFGLLHLVIGRRSGSTLARTPRQMRYALATPLFVFVWMQLFTSTYAEPFSRIGYRCFALTLVIAALPLASFLAMRRGVEPREPSLLGAAAGSLCGAYAGVFVDLWCPLTNAAHALVGHVLPILLLMAVGALVGRRTLGVRLRMLSSSSSSSSSS